MHNKSILPIFACVITDVTLAPSHVQSVFNVYINSLMSLAPRGLTVLEVLVGYFRKYLDKSLLSKVNLYFSATYFTNLYLVAFIQPA